MSDAPPAGQSWSAEGYARHARFVSDLGAEVLALLDPRPGERVLDLGCGDGALTARIAAAGATVTGLEPDPDMARAARKKGVEVREQDAHDPFGEGMFDAVFSNAALHWMRDPPRVFANVRRALRPGGRFVAEQGGFGNVGSVVAALNVARVVRGRDPVMSWDFPTPEAQARRLEAAGFSVRSIALIPRPTPLPTGLRGWLSAFAAPFLRDLPEAEREAVVADAERGLAPLRGPDGAWTLDYVRLRFTAVAA